MFGETERTLSRFLPESELSALNRSAGQPFRASPLMLHAVTEALAAARETDGLFDPTVLNALLAAGYDRSFELLNNGNGEPGTRTEGVRKTPLPDTGSFARDLALHLSPSPRPSSSWRDVVVDQA